MDCLLGPPVVQHVAITEIQHSEQPSIHLWTYLSRHGCLRPDSHENATLCLIQATTATAPLLATDFFPLTVLTTADLLPTERATVRLFQANRASVVNITSVRTMQSFTTLDIHKIPYGSGSGFVW